MTRIIKAAVFQDMQDRLDQEKDDLETIRVLTQASAGIDKVVSLLQATGERFQGSNLPVADAVSHVLRCLGNDAEYLARLASVVKGSAEALKKVA